MQGNEDGVVAKFSLKHMSPEQVLAELNKDSSELVQEVLKRFGIPVDMETGGGYSTVDTPKYDPNELSLFGISFATNIVSFAAVNTSAMHESIRLATNAELERYYVNDAVAHFKQQLMKSLQQYRDRLNLEHMAGHA